MKLILTLFTLASILSAKAATIPIDFGPSGVIFDRSTPFTGLEGTPLLNQDLALDFIFTGDTFIRLFTATDKVVSVMLTFHTSGSGLVGFVLGSGALLDEKGHTIPGFGVTGSASSDQGDLHIGFFPFFKDESGTIDTKVKLPLDFFGVHFDLSLPLAPSVEITGGDFRVVCNELPFSTSTGFGVGPGIPKDIKHVPDTGSTLMMLGMALCVFGVFKMQVQA